MFDVGPLGGPGFVSRLAHVYDHLSSMSSGSTAGSTKGRNSPAGSPCSPGSPTRLDRTSAATGLCLDHGFGDCDRCSQLFSALPPACATVCHDQQAAVLERTATPAISQATQRECLTADAHVTSDDPTPFPVLVGIQQGIQCVLLAGQPHEFICRAEEPHCVQVHKPVEQQQQLFEAVPAPARCDAPLDFRARLQPQQVQTCIQEGSEPQVELLKIRARYGSWRHETELAAVRAANAANAASEGTEGSRATKRGEGTRPGCLTACSSPVEQSTSLDVGDVAAGAAQVLPVPVPVPAEDPIPAAVTLSSSRNTRHAVHRASLVPAHGPPAASPAPAVCHAAAAASNRLQRLSSSPSRTNYRFYVQQYRQQQLQHQQRASMVGQVPRPSRENQQYYTSRFLLADGFALSVPGIIPPGATVGPGSPCAAEDLEIFQLPAKDGAGRGDQQLAFGAMLGGTHVELPILMSTAPPAAGPSPASCGPPSAADADTVPGATAPASADYDVTLGSEWLEDKADVLTTLNMGPQATICLPRAKNKELNGKLVFRLKGLLPRSRSAAPLNANTPRPRTGQASSRPGSSQASTTRSCLCGLQSLFRGGSGRGIQG